MDPRYLNCVNKKKCEILDLGKLYFIMLNCEDICFLFFWQKL